MISATPCLSAPNYTGKEIVYDVSYNINLRNKLEADYYKKCYIHHKNGGSENICGTNSYNYLVLTPYNFLKKNSPND